jgi:DNA repair exonuclease SbcCD ATPase subunit
MLPVRIYLENFMGHVKSDIDCTQFSSCLIVGKNKNNAHISNGVGKSTIFKAIDFVLYGEYNSDKIEEIIRDGADSCKVIFEFLLNDEKYQVIRLRSKSGTHINLNHWVADKWESISAKTNTQTEIELHKLIKISYKALKNSISFAQSDLDGIPSATPDKRKELLKEPLNITIYNKYHKIAKKRLDEQVIEFEKRNFQIESLGNPKKELELCLLEIDKVNLRLVDDRKDYNKNQEILDNKKSQLSDLERLIGSESVDVNNQLIDTKNRIKEVESELTRTNLEYTSALKKMQEFKIDLANKISGLQEKTDNLKKLKAEELRSTTLIQNELSLIIEKEQRGRVIIARLEADESRYGKPIPDVGECGMCLQEIRDDHRNKCEAESIKKLAEIRQDLIKYKEIMAKCLSKRRNLELEQRETAKKLSQIDSFEMEIGNWKNNINKIQELVNQYNTTIENKNNDLVRLNTSLTNLNSRHIILLESAKKFNIKELNDKISIVKVEINNTEILIKKSLSNISSDDTLIGILKERELNHNNNQVKLEHFEVERKEIEDKIKILKRVVVAFGSNGVPSMVINSILGDLEIEANALLQEMRPSLSFRFIYDKDNEDILNIVFYTNLKERSYKLLSGGQRLFVALSFKLGLSKIIQRRLGVDIKFILLDEVDQSLDMDGVQALSEIIKKWQEHFVIFTITHNKFLAEKFQDFIIVSGDDENGSTAKYSTTWDN